MGTPDHGKRARQVTAPPEKNKEALAGAYRETRELQTATITNVTRRLSKSKVSYCGGNAGFSAVVG